RESQYRLPRRWFILEQCGSRRNSGAPGGCCSALYLAVWTDSPSGFIYLPARGVIWQWSLWWLRRLNWHRGYGYWDGWRSWRTGRTWRNEYPKLGAVWFSGTGAKYHQQRYNGRGSGTHASVFPHPGGFLWLTTFCE